MNLQPEEIQGWKDRRVMPSEDVDLKWCVDEFSRGKEDLAAIDDQKFIRLVGRPSLSNQYHTGLIHSHHS